MLTKIVTRTIWTLFVATVLLGYTGSVLQLAGIRV